MNMYPGPARRASTRGERRTKHWSESPISQPKSRASAVTSAARTTAMSTGALSTSATAATPTPRAFSSSARWPSSPKVTVTTRAASRPTLAASVVQPPPFCGFVHEAGTSVPPSSVRRPSKAQNVGFCTIFPASRHSPRAKCGDWSRNVPGACEKTCKDVRKIRSRNHLHQHQVVTLREDVGVDLSRPLGCQEQVKAELTSFAGDLDRVPGHGGLEVVSRLLRADVVRFVSYDQDRLTLVAVPPQASEHRHRDDGLLLRRRERTRVYDQAPPIFSQKVD